MEYRCALCGESDSGHKRSRCPYCDSRLVDKGKRLTWEEATADALEEMNCKLERRIQIRREAGVFSAIAMWQMWDDMEMLFILEKHLDAIGKIQI